MNKLGSYEENRLSSIRTGGDACSNGTLFATFVYDGDGNRVKITMNTTTAARFAQADTIVPGVGNPQAWDRYAYTYNNPLKYTDSTGHNPACGPDGMYCNIHIPRPSSVCIGDCRDAYLTYKSVVRALGYIPSIEEILYITAKAEYGAYIGFTNVRQVGQEGLARNYYEACGKDGICSSDELYIFLSGYEPWTDQAGNNNIKTPEERALGLIKFLPITNGSDSVFIDILEIRQLKLNEHKGWIEGKFANRPWQWFGPFAPNLHKLDGVSFGYLSTDLAILCVNLGNGLIFLMFTAMQDYQFHLDEWQ